MTKGEMKCWGDKYLYGILISLHLQNKYSKEESAPIPCIHLPYIWTRRQKGQE